MKEIEKLREKIDIIDNKILSLIEERGEIAKKIGDIKDNLEIEVLQPSREAEIFKRLKKQKHLLTESNVEAIWKEIMGVCKELQSGKKRVGFLGPEGTFSHQAALDFFPISSTDFISFINIFEIFKNIEKDIIDFGVIPIENSLHGTVRESLDLLIERDVFIHGEIELRIIQNLISLKNTKLEEINTVYSHPQAFAQTKIWLKSNLSKANLINVNSTAEAVKKINELNITTNAAIGTNIACKIYNMKILSSNIEDISSNFTRFLIISKKEYENGGKKIKSSIVFVTKHTPGSLFRAIKIFAEANINLLKIESRPRKKGKWEYIFLMDFEGRKDEENVKLALKSLENNVIWYKILGSYPYK